MVREREPRERINHDYLGLSAAWICKTEVEIWRRKRELTDAAIREILKENVKSFSIVGFHGVAVGLHYFAKRNETRRDRTGKGKDNFPKSFGVIVR